MNIFDLMDLQYKIEGVYQKLFSIKKFRNYILEGNRKEVISYMRSFTQNGCLGCAIGWSERNHTIIDIDRRGVHFNNDETKIYRFREIANLLIWQYGGKNGRQG